MKQAVIFALEDSKNEPNYEALSVLLTKSIHDNHGEVDIFCGVFTNRKPSSKIESMLTDSGVNIIYDQQFNVKDDSINYFLRNYCCYYFSHKHNLLEEYDRLIYLDIDVLVLRNLNNILLEDNAVLVEQVPTNILKFEESYIGTVGHPLYYNWMSIVNNTNKHIWDIDYCANTYLKESDILVSQNINNSNLKIVHQNIGAYYPKHKLMPHTTVFHYDGFIDSGNFWRLEDFFPQMHKKYFAFAQHILNIKQENDKSFWNGF